MSDSNPLQSLRAPITAALSVFATFSIIDLIDANDDPNTGPLVVHVIPFIFWATCISIAAWKSPQALAASSITFTLTAFLATRMQSDFNPTVFIKEQTLLRYKGSTFPSVGPTLWILSGIMCGATFATAWTMSRNADRRPEEIDSIFHPQRIISSGAACIIPFIMLIAPYSSHSFISTNTTNFAIMAFLSGFLLTALSVISPTAPLSLLIITLTWMHIANTSEHARDVSVEAISFPLIAIAATTGLFTMYSFKSPWSRKSS